MEKKQLKKANDLMAKIKSTTDVISRFNELQKLRCLQIFTTCEGCRKMYISTLFNEDGTLHSSDGVHDDIFLCKAGVLAMDYVESILDLLKNQLDSLEKQFKEMH